VPIAVAPATSGTGQPHLDGVYGIGTQRLAGATDEARVTIEKMNHIIHEAKAKLGKKKKKKQK